MDPLSGASPVMEILRRQMSENLEKMRRAGSASAATRELPRLSSQPVSPSLHQTLARRIQSLDARDPQFQERATTLFVESILVSELGEGMVNDPGFRLMIRDVARMMGGEPAIAGELAQLFEELRFAGP